MVQAICEYLSTFEVSKQSFMNQVLFIFIISILFSMQSKAQSSTLDWAFSIGDSTCINFSEDRNKIIATNDGYLYCSGLFCNSVDFDNSEKIFELKSNYQYSNYIAKYDTNGTFIWAKKIGGEVFINSIKVDLEKNVYLSGDFQNFLTFDSSLTKNPYYLESKGHADAVVIKMDGEGQMVWAKTFGGKNYENIASTEIDVDGNVYLFGNFADTVDFDPGPEIYNLYPVTERCDFFAAKLDKEGNFLWAKNLGGTGFDAIYNTTSNLSHQIYIVGFFTDSISFDIANSTETLYTQHYDSLNKQHFSNLLILKMDTEGSVVWARQTLNSTSPYPKITVDSYGDLYIGDNFENTITFGTDSNKLTLISNNYNDPTGYIIKWNSQGIPIWAIQMDGKGICEINAIKTDKYDDLLVTGYYSDTLNYNMEDNTQKFNIKKTESNVFILKYTKEGGFIWAKSMGNRYSVAKDLCLDHNNNFYISGRFSDTTDFDSDIDSNILYCKKNDISNFIAKFNQYPLIEKNVVIVPKSIVYPNPNNGQFKIEVNTNAKASIFNIYGQIIYSMQIEKGITNIDISDKAAGLYFVYVNSQIGNSCLKVLKK